MLDSAGKYIRCPEAGQFEIEHCLMKTVTADGGCRKKGCEVGNMVRMSRGLKPLAKAKPVEVRIGRPTSDQDPAENICNKCKKQLRSDDQVSENALVPMPTKRLCSPCYQNHCKRELTERLEGSIGIKRQIIERELQLLGARMKAAEGRARAREEKAAPAKNTSGGQGPVAGGNRRAKVDLHATPDKGPAAGQGRGHAVPQRDNGKGAENVKRGGAMMVCPNSTCSKKVAKGKKKCPTCGTKMKG